MEPVIDLQTEWTALCSHYSKNDELIQSFWQEIEKNHRDDDRHYHNLDHLRFMYGLFESIREHLDNPNAVLFAIFYHDYVYDASKRDNEKRSAEIAEEKMKKLDVDSDTIHRCTKHILATAKHEESSDPDTNYLLDLDLAILGAETEHYFAYAKSVREEYNMYDELTYLNGRKKVLDDFLSRERIFHTKPFHRLFEERARANILEELTAI